MAYTTPRTWVAGEYPTAAQLNAHLRDNISFLANPPSVRAIRSAGMNILTSTDTPVQWNAEDWDWTTPMHDLVTNTTRFIAPVAGKYRFTFQTDWDRNVTNERVAYVVKNNAGAAPVALGNIRLAAGVESNGSADKEMVISGTLSMAVNDYVEAYVFQDSGATRVFGAGNSARASFELTWFSF